MRFPDPDVTPVPGAGKYRLNTDYIIRSHGKTIRVAAGFWFDGASVPWIAQWLTYSPFHPKVMASALVHDWLYHTHILPKKETDELFQIMLRAFEVPVWKGVIMMWAVQLLGGGAWRRYSGDGLKS